MQPALRYEDYTSRVSFSFLLDRGKRNTAENGGKLHHVVRAKLKATNAKKVAPSLEVRVHVNEARIQYLLPNFNYILVLVRIL